MSLDRRAALALLGALAVSGLGAVAGSTARTRPDLYDCEGCEAVGERPPLTLGPVWPLAGPAEPGQRLLLSGQVRNADGSRPASGVIIYAHQTNAAGLYANGSNLTQWSRRHGRLRGWVKTGSDGHYEFPTIKPAPYPDRALPAHIHLFIGEPGRRPYYIDDVVFDGEFGVTPAYRAAQELRGGSGIVRLRRRADNTLIAVRDIRLEHHPDR
ncbi:dioxygenase family protein [Sphingomonas psychrotolerans]|uniref:Intradiol ring-cleavage dioxygenase n=1 Tax=Sphingomonas psychrotolerans TaxID=1327635 RepID=A0A2K8MB78_9SPHN|nr:intradiol ring-cleavage dioxygenase [Sphingomonas psychrotolerans]ATY31140.1 intradiol ring-cleavage dioxygenase [Sphingomonas psychrotolerans]